MNKNPPNIIPYEFIKVAQENADEANIYGKLTSLYQVLNDVQIRINALEATLPKNYWKRNDKQK
tara:strand:- start:168 stop:359 length:192 start_codon:yes stop_codon:yes gene_type:complete